MFSDESIFCVHSLIHLEPRVLLLFAANSVSKPDWDCFFPASGSSLGIHYLLFQDSWNVKLLLHVLDLDMPRVSSQLVSLSIQPKGASWTFLNSFPHEKFAA